MASGGCIDSLIRLKHVAVTVISSIWPIALKATAEADRAGAAWTTARNTLLGQFIVFIPCIE